MQKFVDQSISTNTHYDPSQFEGNLVPMKLFLMDLLKAYKYGIKTLYYHTTRDGGGTDLVDKQDDDACADGVCKL
jgi:ribonucleoside-diphosphate reductase alpha chain